jgi:hypothetical protein
MCVKYAHHAGQRPLGVMLRVGEVSSNAATRRVRPISVTELLVGHIASHRRLLIVYPPTHTDSDEASHHPFSFCLR